MTGTSRRQERNEKLALLTQTAPDTLMGRLLRRFWQPVALSRWVDKGKAKALRVLGEDLTLYRGESGRAYLVGGRCAHRLTRLHTGWVEGEQVRCIYHGWKYDGTGQCVETPAENAVLPPKIKIAGYPTHEYCGFVFAWLGEGSAPAFDLPRKEVFERSDRLIFAREMTWPCNWLQMVENSLDATHVSFVHQKGRIGTFGEAVTPAIPALEYFETDAGIRQVATRSPGNVRISDWTFPNNNHIIIPSVAKDDPWLDLTLWMVPIDDDRCHRFQLYSVPTRRPEDVQRITDHFAKYIDYNPADHHEELFEQQIYPQENLLQLTNAQDYVAAIGQGAIANRAGERLGASDAGIALLRRIVLRELDALSGGQPLKQWRRLEHIDPLPVPETVRARA